jgi:hypothetical protein
MLGSLTKKHWSCQFKNVQAFVFGQIIFVTFGMMKASPDLWCEVWTGAGVGEVEPAIKF